MKIFEPIEQLFDEMEETGINIARAAISVELKALNEMFPRHTFMYEGRQCLDYVKVSPPLLGEEKLVPWTFSGPNYWDGRASQFPAIQNMVEHLQRINDIHTELTVITRRNTGVEEVF